MEKYLNAPIKQVIEQFPVLADVLNRFGIGCVGCSVGSCLLKDIVSIHHLSPEDESELMFAIEKTIYPQRPVQKPPVRTPSEKPSRAISYSPPVKILVEEHNLIKRMLALIPGAVSDIKETRVLDPGMVRDMVFFIRNYADKFHHAKEEDILFKYSDQASDIIQVMLDDHAVARRCVQAIGQALEKKDLDTIAENLLHYQELLTQHIKKEDEILYPWIDRGLGTHAVGELFAKFSQISDSFEPGVIRRCEEIVTGLEEKMIKRN